MPTLRDFTRAFKLKQHRTLKASSGQVQAALKKMGVERVYVGQYGSKVPLQLWQKLSEPCSFPVAFGLWAAKRPGVFFWPSWGEGVGVPGRGGIQVVYPPYSCCPMVLSPQRAVQGAFENAVALQCCRLKWGKTWPNKKKAVCINVSLFYMFLFTTQPPSLSMHTGGKHAFGSLVF